MNRVRLVAALSLIALATFRLSGCERFEFADVLPVPTPVVDPDATVWLVVVEEKSDRPEGMAAFERSRDLETLRSKNVRYFNVNDDDPSPTAREYIEALNGMVPGFIVMVDGGDVLAKGTVPDPVPDEFFVDLIEKEAGR